MKFRRVVPWTQERVIEGILTRALRNESLVARSTQPRSLVAAARRFFGSWSAALEEAGVEPKATAFHAAAPLTHEQTSSSPTNTKSMHRQAHSWTSEAVVAAILVRLRQQKPMNASALSRDDNALYMAARRHFSNWRNALIAAGLNPEAHQLVGKAKRHRKSPAPLNESLRKSQSGDAMRPDDPAQDHGD
jgi:hypothetical protein